MKKRLLSFLLILSILIGVLCSCSESDPGPLSSGEDDVDQIYRVACHIDEDGWVYVFTNSYLEGDADFGSQAETYYPFGFMGINLRYRYSDAYTTEIETKNAKGEKVLQTVLQSTLILGNSDDQAARGDLEKISEYLGYSRDGHYYATTELLDLTPEEIGFTCIDPEMFLDLLHECLASESVSLGPYPAIPSWALFTEPDYLSNYKIQVGLIGGLGTVEVVVFDVLYRTGAGVDGYTQLYDLVQDGSATDEQVELLRILREIEQGVVSTDDLQWNVGEYGDMEIAGVSLRRLYTMLNNISRNEYSDYLVHTQ